MTLLQASELADHYLRGLLGADSIPATPARWLDGLPQLEDERLKVWLMPLGSAGYAVPGYDRV